MDPNTQQPVAQNIPPLVPPQPPWRGWGSLSIKDLFQLTERIIFSVAAGIVGIFPWLAFNHLLFGDYLNSIGLALISPLFTLYFFLPPFLIASFAVFRLQNHSNRAVSGIVRWVGILCFSLVAAVALVSLLISMVDRPQSTQQTPQPIVQNPSTPTPTSDPTANWKTYTNLDYGFSVKYQSNFTYKQAEGDTFLFHAFFQNPTANVASADGFSIEIRALKNLEEEVEYRKWQVEHSTDRIKEESSITKDGYQGKKLDYEIYTSDPEARKSYSIVVLKGNNYNYTIEAGSKNIDQILSTFKFTE